MSIDVSRAPEAPATGSPNVGISATPRTYLKSCCDVPREQPCRHDLPTNAFEPGCGKAIMCRPASQWGDPATILGVDLHRLGHPDLEDGCVLCETIGGGQVATR